MIQGTYGILSVASSLVGWMPISSFGDIPHHPTILRPLLEPNNFYFTGGRSMQIKHALNDLRVFACGSGVRGCHILPGPRVVYDRRTKRNPISSAYRLIRKRSHTSRSCSQISPTLERGRRTDGAPSLEETHHQHKLRLATKLREIFAW